MRTILESTGEYEVCSEAGDGDTTLALAIRLHPDVVITDISMAPVKARMVATCDAEFAGELDVISTE